MSWKYAGVESWAHADPRTRGSTPGAAPPGRVKSVISNGSIKGSPPQAQKVLRVVARRAPDPRPQHRAITPEVRAAGGIWGHLRENHTPAAGAENFWTFLCEARGPSCAPKKSHGERCAVVGPCGVSRA